MPGRAKRCTAAAFLIAVGVLCSANVWITFGRTLIPSALDGRVTDLAWLQAKAAGWPGEDSANLVTMESGRVLEVEPEIYHRLRVGDRLRKTRWSATLRRNEETIPLRISSDALGMFALMPAVLAGAIALSIDKLRRPDPGDDPSGG